MSQNRLFWILSGVFILLFVVGVVVVIVLANRPFVDYRIVSPTALPLTDPFIATQTAQPSPTLDPTTAMTILPPPSTTAQVQSVDCGWMWATQINPELSAEIQQQLAEVLISVGSVEARAEGFGENCLNRDGTVRYFATMETHFWVVVKIDSLPPDDLTAAQEIVSPVVRDILNILADYPVEDTPGPMPGQINIQFPVRNTAYWLSADYNAAMDALNQNLRDNALLDALGGLRS